MADISQLHRSVDAMAEQCLELVACESPSHDLDALTEMSQLLHDYLGEQLGSEPRLIDDDGRPHLLWSAGPTAEVVLVGHFDTVWPRGTLARLPACRDGEVLRGPGCFDMKAGIVQGAHAIAALERRDGVALVLTSDEEIGSHSGRRVITQTTAGVRAALVLEPSASRGELKVARKGVGSLEIQLTGRAAHAGLEPDKGVNSIIEASHEVQHLAALTELDQGTTVIPSIISGGSSANTIPAFTSVTADLRAATTSEMERVRQAVESRTPDLPGIERQVHLRTWRPPMQQSTSSELLDRVIRVCASIGITPPGAIAVGGGSDGNFTAAAGTPTLDGLGAVGGDAHGDDEHVVVPRMPERAALLAALIEDLMSSPGPPRSE